MRILLLAGSYPPETGGIAQFMRAFVDGLRRRNVDVDVISNLPVTGGYLRRVRAWRSAAIAQCSAKQVDRIVASSWSPFAVGLPITALDVPFDVFCHGMDLLEPSHSIRYRFLMKRTLRRAGRVLANSAYTADLAQSFGASNEKTVVLPPGVDTDRFTPTPHQPRVPTILSVGRLVERKGFDVVLRALPLVLERFPNAVYLCVGSGPDENRLKTLASAAGIANHVRFIGEASDAGLVRIYQSADIFVMPNRIVKEEGSVEGFGIVFVEAGACGLPVIGGNSGGVPEVIADGITGFLIDPIDPAILATRICALLADSNLRDKMGSAGREQAIRMFQEDRIAERYLASIHPGNRMDYGSDHLFR